MQQHMKSLLFSVGLIFALAYSAPSVAGEFYTSCYSDISCSPNITDVVADRFTTRFPSSQYEIVAYVDSNTLGDGKSIAFATVGVTPRTDDRYGQMSLFPVRRFSVYWHGSLGNKTLQIEEIDVLRMAVANMIKSCAKTKNCDILIFK
ncbi:MAG: hypothetical protein ACYCT1_05405 [Steroidobacteraceae bacterium]